MDSVQINLQMAARIERTLRRHTLLHMSPKCAFKVFDRPPRFAFKTDQINSLAHHDGGSALGMRFLCDLEERRHNKISKLSSNFNSLNDAKFNISKQLLLVEKKRNQARANFEKAENELILVRGLILLRPQKFLRILRTKSFKDGSFRTPVPPSPASLCETSLLANEERQHRTHSQTGTKRLGEGENGDFENFMTRGLEFYKHTKDKHIVLGLSSSTIDQNTTLVIGGEYEAFLSFCGKDTRKAFVDFLYIYLVGTGIRTFRDNNELCIGEEIRLELLKAIKESKISIPIFSKSYAASKYCLLELTMMVECHRSEGQKIFPIFYNIKPSEVRHQTGSYENAFSQHDKNFEENVVLGWKDALRKVGELKGLELEETNGHEGELVKMVVEKVLLELKKNYKHVPDNVVGMDHHIEELMGLLNFDFVGIRIVGIHGMGGIEKTTIAKAVLNKLYDYFQCCCFIEDVREKAKCHNGLVNLQVQLVSKFRKGEFGKFNDVNEGTDRIKDAVHSKKVLIVLDDVDEKFQFDHLAGKLDWFGAGSRVIVTTRNKQVLDSLKVTFEKESLHDAYRSYEPNLMNPKHALVLFSRCAFMRDFPPEGYDILSKQVVCAAAGLPLGTRNVAALHFKFTKPKWRSRPNCFVGEDFEQVQNLRFLSVINADLDGDFKHLHRIDGLEQLEFLNYLNAAACVSIERLPNLSKLKKLKTLQVKKCEKLIEIQGLAMLQYLEQLNMSDHKSRGRLASLSNMIKELDLSNLKKLKKLKIAWLESLTKIKGLEGMKYLELLDVEGSSHLKNYLLS
ncbi:hypothetical protein LguiB_013129 [Lonicera macranthoides]